MNLQDVVIDRAGLDDIDGILDLAKRNGPDHGGELSVRLERKHLQIQDVGLPNIVARRNGKVVGFLLTQERNPALPPIVHAMLAVYPGSPNAYMYGPICVETAERGRGLAVAMFEELRRLQPGREGVLFIKASNKASLQAHRKMGMREVAEYVFNGVPLVVFAYDG
jgi:ribosomal protein S18 acetylase RimI-like enzyme